jgi:hypothetical protein
LVLFVTGVLNVACFTSSLVFLALKTSDLARFPQRDLKTSFKIFIHGDGPLFVVNFLYQTLLFRFLGFRLDCNCITQKEGKFYKAKPKRKSRTFRFWFAITWPNRVFQIQKVAQNAPLLPYFLEPGENLGSEKSLFEPFS